MTAGKSTCPCSVVVFGASGDLARRKLMPALFNLECDGFLQDDLKVVGFGRSGMDDEAFRREVMIGVSVGSGGGTGKAAYDRFASRLHYVRGEYSDPSALSRLRARLTALKGESPEELYYLALPPSVSESLLGCMAGGRFAPASRSARIMIEKPFGTGLEGARRMNALLAAAFDESRVYRIDHYLAKDTVRNLLVLRFANTIFEPLWNAGYVDHVQITAAEEIGVESRGSTYEEIGVVRDVIQNHVMQLLALAAMEPPAGGDPEMVRDRKVEVFESLVPIGPDDFVLGQYRGYREERNVPAGSRTPTFAAVRMLIENERWDGVPFYLRAGKRLARSAVEVAVRFREVPWDVFETGAVGEKHRPNSLVVRIQPDEGIRLSFSIRQAGREEEIVPANLAFRYSEIGGALSGGYERVLLDGLEGKPSLFWRADGIEAAWRAVEPLLEPSGAPASYRPGSWGPVQADELLRRDGRAWSVPR